ncbi:MAG: universal stress protein [Anaerolineae bacterium]|nr:universal stress protein [Anaerolineae bacterium]
MNINPTSPAFQRAIRDFHRVRQQAAMEDLVAAITGKSDDLLDYNEVYEQLKGGPAIDRGLQDIPLDAIVGSVGRCTEFTRTFLPRAKGDIRRWAEVKTAIVEQGRFRPINVYQIDQVYFVLDGNHRVSIARQEGHPTIQAYVTEIKTDVPLTPAVQPDDLICKARYVDFLEKTRLHELRPEADLSVTVPGQYRILEDQIEQYRHRLSRRRQRDISPQEAVERWYDELYRPGIQLIRRQGLLRLFPNRTETDLYAWIVQHQAELRQELGWEVAPSNVAANLANVADSRPWQIVKRTADKVRQALTPLPLDPGPPPGWWRTGQPRSYDQLFRDIVVPITGERANWAGLTQALTVAQRDGSRLHGLHVVSAETEAEVEAYHQLQAEFDHRCRTAAINGELTLKRGKVIPTICDQARWADLVVMHLAHLPRPRPADRLLSRFGTLMRRSPRPVLAVPDQPASLNRALLAYDGSPKANEALFIAAYLAGKWQTPLTVVTVTEDEQVGSAVLQSAQAYLEEQDVPATYVQEQGIIASAIIRTAQLYTCDFMIMGGYGYSPVLEIMLGSEVDQILRARQWPVLICR